MELELTWIIVALLIILALGLSFSIGANDETPAPLAAVGIIKFSSVLMLGGFGLGFGTIFFSRGVASMVGEGILGPGITYSIWMLLSVLISTIIWLIVGSFMGIPLSSTHSLVGSIFGVVIVFSLFSGGIDPLTAFNNENMLRVVFSWFWSPLLGLLITLIIYKILERSYLSRLKGLNQIEKSERMFSITLIIAVFFANIWVGANSAEALGILYALYVNESLTIEGYYFYVVLCAISAFFGLYIAGRYVLRNLAGQLTEARPSDGVVIQISSSIILMICTIIYNVPISHSHLIVFCIIAMNIAQKKDVDYRGLGRMAIYWILTFPIAAIGAGIVYWILGASLGVM